MVLVEHLVHQVLQVLQEHLARVQVAHQEAPGHRVVRVQEERVVHQEHREVLVHQVVQVQVHQVLVEAQVLQEVQGQEELVVLQEVLALVHQVRLEFLALVH
jgi:hypothetical protein